MQESVKVGAFIGLFSLAIFIGFANTKVPKIKSRSEAANKIATTGNKVRLSCAVTSFNEKEQHDAKYVWTKNGKPVIEGWRLRIRKLKYLRIKKVEENDAGRYQCIVSDQDGQDSIVINLYVVGSFKEFTGMAGTITSPNYPSNYPNNSNIWYYINVDIPHFRIKVTFDNGFRLDSNCKKDNVTIYDGETTSFPVLGNRDGYCGSSPPPALGSTKNKMLIVFRTDENISFSGFSLKYSRDCDELYTSEFDRIQLIRYPGIHGKNITCKYQIDVPKPGYSITINFEEFDIQYSSNCRQESVSIFDGQTTSDAMLGIYCGRRRPFYLRSSHNKMLIVFKMNPTPFRKWFQLSYKAACYREFTSWSGDVVSPNYPDDYLNNLDCYFIIRCPFIPGFRIKVEFKFFSLEDNCVYDSLTLYDGITTSAKKLGNSNGYCGNSLPPRLYASSNQMLITFKTDNAHVRKGFSLKFNYVRSCDMTYTSETGKIMSPAYSKNNQRNMTCKYLINVSKPGHVIKIYFRKFDVQYSLECKDESVSVFDGQTVNDTLLGIYCGSAKPAFLRSSSDKILIVFKSSAIADTKGFQLSYRTECYYELTSPIGTISSINYPEPYPHNLYCRYLIKANTGYSFKIEFKYLDMEGRYVSTSCKNDNLTFYDGLTTKARRLKNSYITCGSTWYGNLPKLYSSGNEMLVVFRTNERIAAKGFRLTYTRSKKFVDSMAL